VIEGWWRLLEFEFPTQLEGNSSVFTGVHEVLL